MKININIGGKILTATLADNATARDFVSVLPLKLSMKDLFRREKYGDLPKALSEKGPRKNRYEVGDIAYWSPNRQFVVYYNQDGVRQADFALPILAVASVVSGRPTNRELSHGASTRSTKSGAGL